MGQPERLWPADKVERRRVADLVPYARNARTHSEQQVAQVAASIREWGWTIPILIDEEGGIIAGHCRVMAANKLKIDEVPCMTAKGWSEAQKRAYILADNKLAMNAGWDEEILRLELSELSPEHAAMAGFSAAELEAFSLWDAEEDEDSRSDGSLLALLDVTIGDPRHEVSAGDVWRVGKHLLFCCSVMTQWSKWASALDGEKTIFVPYPGPFVPLSKGGEENLLIMVQPDRYIAGHILDRYADINGEDSVRLEKGQ